MLVLQIVTPVHSENKSFEGRAYVSRTCNAVVEMADRQGNPYQDTVKLNLDESTSTQVRVGQKYTLGAASFYVKDGRLAFSPKLVPIAVAGGAK